MSNSTYSSSPSPVNRSQSPLLQEVRNCMRRRHMSIRTEGAYIKWLEEFLRYHRRKAGTWQHPRELGDEAINEFLTHLAVDRNVAASTQNQAFSAILFLYRQVLQLEISIDAERAKKPERLPVVLSIEEVRQVLREIPQGPLRTLAGLMYGSGLRLMEACGTASCSSWRQRRTGMFDLWMTARSFSYFFQGSNFDSQRPQFG